MRVLLTGASGFLGRHVAAALVDAGVQVRGLARNAAPVHPAVEPFVADLASSQDLEAAFLGVDVLVHLAASMRGPASLLERDNLEGSRRLLQAMARSATRRVVLASSLSVYNWMRVDRTLSEEDELLDDSSLAQCDAYARSKALQEQLTRAFARTNGCTLTVLRCAAIWGANFWADFVLGKRWRGVQAVVAPRAPARLVYLHNAVDAFVKAAQREAGGELVLNLVDESKISNWQYARIVQKHRGGVLIPMPYAAGWLAARCASRMVPRPNRLPYFLRPAPFQTLHKPAACANAAVRARLEWTPRFTVQQALEHMRSRREVAWS
jgi:2-alkyl-3-oxoalkanoate reductase